MMARKTWTPEDEKLFRKRYPYTSTAVLAKEMGRSVQALFAHADVIGVKKDPAFKLKVQQQLGKQLSATDNGHRFKKGSAPVTKGKKWEDYMTPEGMKNARKSQFTNGHLPKNTLHNGAIRIRTDTYDNGTQRKYKWIRISLAKWVMLHVYKWENKYGKVPAGKIVVFKDGDSLNCTLKKS